MSSSNQSSLCNTSAYTFLELLLVLGVISLLMSLSFPTYRMITHSTQKSTSSIIFQTYLMALEDYRTTYGSYPSFLKPGEAYSLRNFSGKLIQSLTQEEASEAFNPLKRSFLPWSEQWIIEKDNKLFLSDGNGKMDLFLYLADENQSWEDQLKAFPEKIQKLLSSKAKRPQSLIYSLENDGDFFTYP